MDTLDSITTLAAKQFGVDPTTIDADVPLQQLGADSLGLLEFLFELEDHFGVPIPQDSVATVGSLRELAAVIDGLRAAAPPASS